MCSTPRADRKVEQKALFILGFYIPRSMCSALDTLPVLGRVWEHQDGSCPHSLGTLEGISLIPVLVVPKKGCALGYLGIYGFSGEAEH